MEYWKKTRESKKPPKKLLESENIQIVKEKFQKASLRNIFQDTIFKRFVCYCCVLEDTSQYLQDSFEIHRYYFSNLCINVCAYIGYDTGLKAKPEDPDLAVFHQAKDSALIQ